MKQKTRIFQMIFIVFVFFLMSPTTSLAEESSIPLDKVKVDLTDLPSLQRGAKLFMNYCSGCHSLKFVRFNTMAKDIGIVDSSNQVLEKAVKENLIFSGDKVGDVIETAMAKADGANWFGISPPDLSLEARLRGANWIYTYLRNFYADPSKTWGVNNRVFPDVAMPNVLADLQAQLTPQQFDASVTDLVNFLVYVSEPNQEERKRLGVWVLLFLGVFFVFAVLLKREYWKDVHKE